MILLISVSSGAYTNMWKGGVHIGEERERRQTFQIRPRSSNVQKKKPSKVSFEYILHVPDSSVWVSCGK